MNSIEKNSRSYLERVVLCLVAGLLAGSLSGCQNLFHAQDAPLKGQTVTVSMTVPETPLPAVQPLKQKDEPVSTLGKKPLDSRLLPTLAPTAPGQLSVPRQITYDRAVSKKADTVIAGKTVTEDMVLRGSVLIKGSLVIAPQATLRVEPGSVIRFAPSDGTTLLPRLVIQGRIVAAGTVQQPVLFASVFRDAVAGDWGGLVLLNSEKKNSLDYCRIESAQTGLEAHFSRFSSRGLVISNSQSAVALFDSEASLQSGVFSRCDVGLRLSDSELDLRDSTVRENRLGLLGSRSSFTLTGVKMLNNSQEGIVSDQCRFRLTSSVFSENRNGVRLSGGDGQVFLCRFFQNRENGAELIGARIRINNSTFLQNAGVGIVLENARGTVVGSVFENNKGGNMQNRGTDFFAALLNWWGTVDERQIATGILDPTRKDYEGVVLFVPFLKERPATAF